MANVKKSKQKKKHKKQAVVDVNKRNKKVVNKDRNVKQKDAAKGNNRDTVKVKKISMSLSKAEEQEINKATEREDSVSVFVMVLVLIFCFVCGISLGYLLYKIAISGRM